MGRFISKKTLIFLITAIIIAIIAVSFARVRERKIDYEQFFRDHQEEMTIYAEQFLEQPNIKVIGRFKSLYGFFYNMYAAPNSDEEEPYISFGGPYNEVRFWKEPDLAKIKSGSEITLEQFLENNEIPQDEYLKWRAILAKHNFSRIMRINPFGDDENSVTFQITSGTGFLYRTNDGAAFPHSGSIFKVLNENWGYYDEDGITN